MKLAPFNWRPEVIIDTEKNSLMNRVNRWDSANARDVTIIPDRGKRHGHGRKNGDNGHDEAGEHLDSLRETAAQVNRGLAAKDSPYRFYVFSEDGEVYINLVLLGPDGSVARVTRKAITHAEFSDLVRQLEKGEGLFFEMVG